MTTWYYAEFEDLVYHKNNGVYRELPNDGHWQFTAESDAHAISDAINKGCDLSADLLVVYTEHLVDGQWKFRTIWERKEEE